MKIIKFYSNLPFLFLSTAILLLLACKVSADQEANESINLGNWTESKLDSLMTENSKIPDPSSQIEFLSGRFLGTSYEDHTLTGDVDTPEMFTINLAGMDCFTYIDYVEALRVSDTYPEFKGNLKEVRYRDGKIAFQNRNHFFTDWPVNNPGHVRDVTGEIGGEKTKSAKKNLNVKKDGTVYLPGIAPNEREVYYIPTEAIDAEMVSKLDTGDYVGIYTELPGLDVTHTGIIIKKDGKTYLRHASSRSVNNKVVDEDLLEYMENKPGLVVFRPLNM